MKPWRLLAGFLFSLLFPAVCTAQCRIYYASNGIERAPLHGAPAQRIVSRGKINALGIDGRTGFLVWSENISNFNEYSGALYDGLIELAPGQTPYGINGIYYSEELQSLFLRRGSQVYRLNGATLQPLFPPYLDAGAGDGLTRDPSTGRWYFGGAWGISVTEADGSGGSTVPGVGINIDSRAIFFDPATDLLYYTAGPDKIYRISKNGGTPQLVASNVLTSGFTADFTGGALYWVSADGTTILKSNLDGTSVTPLRSGLAGVERIVFARNYGRLIFAKDYEIFSIALDGSDLIDETSIPASPEDPVLAETSVYFLSKSGKAIFRNPLEGAFTERFFHGLGSPEGLAIDPASRLIYWGDTENGTISSGTLDGGNQTVVLTGIGPITDLALDSVRGKLYWSEVASGTGSIKSSSVSTPAIETVLTGLGDIRGLDVDDASQTLFWAENDVDGRIIRWHSGESSPQTIATLLNFSYGHPQFGTVVLRATPNDIKFSEELGKVFWSNNVTLNNPGILERANSDGSAREVLIRNLNDYDSRGEFSLSSTSTGACGNSYNNSGFSGLSLYRPQTGSWYIYQIAGITYEDTVIYRPWGLPGDLPVQGDFDGDGRFDLTVWRPSNGNWYTCPSGKRFDCSQNSIIQFGRKGDYPLTGRLDDDEIDDFVVWRPFGPGEEGNWYIRNSTMPTYDPITVKQWGLKNDIPVLADFDGDRYSDLTVWRPSTGVWYITKHAFSPFTAGQSQVIVKQWGLPGDHPMAGDYDGDGRADLAVWRPSDGRWYICGSKQEFDCAQGYSVQFGLPGDFPISADFDADSILDFAVWRPILPPVLGQWYYKRSSDGFVVSAQWGLPGDVPLKTSSKALRTFYRQ